MQVISFNSGRHYTINCQRIVACHHEKKLYFKDLDRGVDGVFDVSENFPLCFMSVMKLYDKGGYEGMWSGNTPKEVEEAMEQEIKKITGR